MQLFSQRQTSLSSSDYYVQDEVVVYEQDF